jgi:hypothetical protein
MSSHGDTKSRGQVNIDITVSIHDVGTARLFPKHWNLTNGNS